jgi:imidazolonepropionase-like amidohydrolase
MRALLPVAVALAILVPPAGPVSAEGAPPSLLVVKGDLSLAVLTDPAARLDAVGLLVRDGKIVGYLAEGETPPEGARVIDGGEAFILPGLVDACELTADARRDAPKAMTPDHLAIDGFDPYTREDAALSQGVTTMWLSPARNRLLSGVGAVVRTAGDDRVLAAAEGLRATLGREGLNPPAVFEPPTRPDPIEAPIRPSLPPPPSTRAAAAAMLRAAFREGGDARLLAAREGRLRVRLHASSAEEIRLAIAIARETKLSAVLEIASAKAAAEVVEELADAGFPVVLESGGPDARTLMRRAGPVALARPGASPLVLGSTVALHGGDRDALRAITIDAARVLGVHHRVGSLDVGKDADLLLVDGAPFAAEASIRTVLVGGEVVHERRATDGLLAIRAGRILTGDGGVIEDGVLVCRGGEILEVGRDVRLPPDAERRVWPGTVVAGFVDAWSHDGVPPGDLMSGVASAILPDEAVLKPLRERGVTGLVLVPRGTGTAGGVASVIGTSTRPDGGLDVVRARAGLLLNVYTTGDRAGRALAIRDLLDKVDGYVKAWADYEAAKAKAEESKDKPKAPKRDGRLEPFREAVAGSLPVLVRAERTPEVAEALAFAKRFPEADVVLIGATGAFQHVDAIGKADLPVLLAGLPRFDVRSRGSVDLPRELARGGLRIAIGSSGSTFDPVEYAAEAVRRGLSPRITLASLTSVAADALGVAAALGRVRPGLRADLVHLSADPGEPGCHVRHVVARGRIVYERKDSR